MIITIDGPTASGKSTMARLLAKELHFYYINTGLLYRALAYILMEKQAYTYDMLARPKRADIQAIIDPTRLLYEYTNTASIIFDGQDITMYLKDAAIDKGASIVSGVSLVRDLLLEYQQNIARHHDVVVEGRDTGSIVFAQADYKFYLTADTAVRAQRWLGMQQARNSHLTLEEALQSITERDTRDRERKLAPLVIPQGAIIIDNSYMSQDETLKAFLSAIR